MDAESSERQGTPNKDGDPRSTAGCTADQGAQSECGPFRSPHESSGRSGSSLAVLPGSDLVSYPSGIVQLQTVSPVKTVEKPSIRDGSRQGGSEGTLIEELSPGHDRREHPARLRRCQSETHDRGTYGEKNYGEV